MLSMNRSPVPAFASSSATLVSRFCVVVPIPVPADRTARPSVASTLSNGAPLPSRPSRICPTAVRKMSPPVDLTWFSDRLPATSFSVIVPPAVAVTLPAA